MKEVLFSKMVKKASKIIVASHQNSDVDAVLSCFATKKLISRINPLATVTIVTPGMNVQARRIVESLGISSEIQDGDSIIEYDLCLLVDVNNPAHLGPLRDYIDYNKLMIIIDHHRPSTNMPPRALAILDEGAVATAEVLCDLMINIDVRPSREEAQCLLIGILSDSRRLSIGTSKTMRDISYLISCGASLPEAVAILSMPMTYSEKIARLKASQRALIYSLGQWIVVTSKVGSYEASAARALIDLGADLAAVCNELDNEIRLCVRANEEFVKRTGMHLGEEMDRLGSLMSGSGGGHASAACATIPKGCEDVVGRFLTLVSGKLGLPIKKID
ncbi:MAG: DHH family phosphoesterase [Candidatus Nezhaarchaeales archaeon]